MKKGFKSLKSKGNFYIQDKTLKNKIKTDIWRFLIPAMTIIVIESINYLINPKENLFDIALIILPSLLIYDSFILYYLIRYGLAINDYRYGHSIKVYTKKFFILQMIYIMIALILLIISILLRYFKLYD